MQKAHFLKRFYFIINRLTCSACLLWKSESRSVTVVQEVGVRLHCLLFNYPSLPLFGSLCSFKKTSLPTRGGEKLIQSPKSAATRIERIIYL